MIHHSPCAMKNYHPVADHSCVTYNHWPGERGLLFQTGHFYLSVVVVVVVGH